MAPSKQAPGPPFAKDEKVLCFHGDLMYEAKITEVRSASDPTNTNFATIKADDAQYKVHYKGWKSSWDDWVTQDRIRKFNDDNKALAAQLQQAARLRTAGGSKSAKKAIGKAVGGVDSEMSSARGSEERAATNSYAGRGPRRGRDYELESVSRPFFLSVISFARLGQGGVQCTPTWYMR
ncbi:chromo domain-like protein [Truncatella angustata]|uniref:Chromatin modification-related protein EAF3 n=1 Tax=Truncatella angustata TaxID=152316 RepID=A0A9P8UBW3_9PEZI|nr:chromo domain-like protein [Truncatella angustata]KAH6645936.1 chromo domain-like protein [Truncatella angustata]